MLKGDYNKKYRQKKKDEYSLFSLKVIIFSILFIICSYSLKNDDVYFFEDIQNYCYYCFDRTVFEIKHKGENYIFLSKDLAEFDRDLLIKNLK